MAGENQVINASGELFCSVVFLFHERGAENSYKQSRLVKLHSRLRISTGSSLCRAQELCGRTLSLLAAPGAGQVCG